MARSEERVLVTSVSIIFVAFTLLYVTTTGMFNSREVTIAKMAERHKLPPPPIVMKRDEDPSRTLIYLAEEQSMAIDYALHFEEYYGRQKWLNRVFETYAMTPEEYDKIKKIYTENGSKYQAMQERQEIANSNSSPTTE